MDDTLREKNYLIPCPICGGQGGNCQGCSSYGQIGVSAEEKADYILTHKTVNGWQLDEEVSDEIKELIAQAREEEGKAVAEDIQSHKDFRGNSGIKYGFIIDEVIASRYGKRSGAGEGEDGK